MKRLIVDFSNLLWTSLLVGKDGENGKKIQHNGKEIYINSAQWGVDCAINVGPQAPASNASVTTMIAALMAPPRSRRRSWCRRAPP